MKVFLNPGHDLLLDPGACGNGLKEADVVKKAAKLVEKYLTTAGVEVVGNLQDDDLQYVCATANQSGADIFVSIHCNAALNELARGTETFICPLASQAKALASFIQTEIVTGAQTINRGIKEANFYVLTQTCMPAVLVELAFLSNEDDAILLKESLDEFAKGIARGVTDYEKLIMDN